MIGYYVVSAICFLLILFNAAIMFVAVVKMDRKGRIFFVRNFKKGRFFVVYIIAIPLFFMGIFYASPNDGFLNIIFTAIHKTVNLVVLKYELAPFWALAEAVPFYKATLFFTYFMVLVNALTLAISIVGRYLTLVIKNLRFNLGRGRRVYFFGANDGNFSLYKTCDDKNKIVIGATDKKLRDEMYEKAILYNADSLDVTLGRVFRFVQNEQVVLIVNTGDDNKNVVICKRITDELSTIKKEQGDDAPCFKNLIIYLFGDPLLSSVYDDIVHEGLSCIRLVTKYQQIAMDFIDDYPLAKFMNNTQLDYKKGTVIKGVNINVAFVGFGKTARQIFLTSVANNQFICEEEGKTKLKKVNYFMFDKNEKILDKDLNHTYYRYEKEMAGASQADYLEFPDMAAESQYLNYDVNDERLYPALYEIFHKGKNDANFVIIAFGNDLENIDYAQKLIEKSREWKIKNLTIFVKSRKLEKQSTFVEQKNCHFIANLDATVYNFKKLTDGKIYEMAKMRNYAYEIEKLFGNNDLNKVDFDKLVKTAELSWFGKSNLERYSNLFCCLSLRQKLNLFGFDCVSKEEDGKAVSKEDFTNYYQTGYPIKYATAQVIDGMRKVECDYEFLPSLRTNLAILEHYRWNSFMLSHGFIPATRKSILTDWDKDKNKYTNGKDYSIRQHGNLTTFDGLKEFSKIVSERDGGSWKDADVIKYDYQIMDESFWILDKVNRKIVKKADFDKQ